MKSLSAPNRYESSALTRARKTVGLLAGLAVLGLLLAGGVCWRSLADEPAVNLGKGKDFFVPDYYDPPNQNQVKSLLRGAEAQFQMDGRVVLIKELQVESYATNGKTLIIMRAPDCTYDRVNQTASSSNHFEATSGDGQMFIQGEGFRWEQTNSVFTISNQVYTKIRQESETPAEP